MSLDADFVYDGTRHDVSHRVVFNYFSELHPDREDRCVLECQVSLEQLLRLHRMLCERLHEELMDLELDEFTVSEEVIQPVRKAIKAMRDNPGLTVWFDGGW